MSTNPTFATPSDATGLTVIDPIETRHFSLLTDSPVAPTDADPGPFAFPVTTACRIRTGRLELPYVVPMEVRTPGGDHRASIDLPTTAEFARGEHLVELHSPVKIYLRVDSAMTIDVTDDAAAIEFGGQVPVEVGARSYHSAPASTVTVPDDPTAMMEAVSTFSSALKTTSCERAWPTLRGHPPRVERGDELAIPDELEPPDTGVTISVPPEYGHVYAVAPLAYYLGADVVPDERAQLTADSGVARFLGEDVAAVCESVESLLRRVFLLDCVTRTEGLYPDDLHERDVLETRVDLDFAALYDASLAERLRTYLSVPDEAISAIDSQWHRVTHVRPDPDTVELLPYVVNDLSLVQVEDPSATSWTPTEAQKRTGEALDAFVRGGAAAGADPGAGAPASAGGSWDDDGSRGDDFLRSAGPRRSIRGSGRLAEDEREQEGDEPNREKDEQNQEESERDDETARADDGKWGVPGEDGYIPLPETDALEQAWVGDRTPVEGTKLLKEAFEHETTTSEDGTVEITVVCNDEEMRRELDSAAEIYGNREDLRTDVTCEFGVPTDDLRDLLAADSDMFHFIGHIDGVGFQCPDGVLDAETLDATGAKTVLLNGCRSHDQGVALVEAGASAAVVSLADLWNSGAVEVGETLARLFYHGFSIGHAMEIVREHTSLGGEYVVLGDPGVTLTQCENGMPTMYHISETSDGDKSAGEITVESRAYPIRGYGLGSIFRPHLPGVDYYHIAVGAGDKIQIPADALQRKFRPISEPLIVEGELTWTDTWFNT